MTTLMINQTTTGNRTTYEFTSRGTSYTVIEREYDEGFEVISERLGASFGMQVAVMTLKEMAARSKALAHLCAIINTDNVASA
jgi:predicted MarR family transcription regulator